MKCFALVFSLFSCSALSGEVVTMSPPRYELHKMLENTLVPPSPKTWEECITRAAVPGTWDCVMRQRVTTVATCDEMPPTFPRIVVDGFIVKPALRVRENPDGSWGPTEVESWVKASFIYPDCWVMGWKLYTGEDPEPEGPLEMEPVYGPGEGPP